MCSQLWRWGASISSQKWNLTSHICAYRSPQQKGMFRKNLHSCPPSAWWASCKQRAHYCLTSDARDSLPKGVNAAKEQHSLPSRCLLESSQVARVACCTENCSLALNTLLPGTWSWIVRLFKQRGHCKPLKHMSQNCHFACSTRSQPSQPAFFAPCCAKRWRPALGFRFSDRTWNMDSINYFTILHRQRFCKTRGKKPRLNSKAIIFLHTSKAKKFHKKRARQFTQFTINLDVNEAFSFIVPPQRMTM